MTEKETDEDLKVKITCPLCGHVQEYDIVFEGELKEEDDINAS